MLVQIKLLQVLLECLDRHLLSRYSTAGNALNGQYLTMFSEPCDVAESAPNLTSESAVSRWLCTRHRWMVDSWQISWVFINSMIDIFLVE